jgi:RNA polymerase sigma-70 factor (ECF subfamily)
MRERGRGHLFLVTERRSFTDADLVAAFVREEEWASAAIWERFAPMVQRILYRGVGPGHDVDDLVQEAFLRLFRKLRSLRDPAALKSFVVAVTTRVLQTELRARWLKRWLGLSDDGVVPESATPGADLDAREALSRFYQLLDGLGVKQRAAFTLRYIEGLELTEVAAGVGVSLATIKRWLPRVSKKVYRQAERDPLLKAYLSLHGFEVVTHD